MILILDNLKWAVILVQLNYVDNSVVVLNNKQVSFRSSIFDHETIVTAIKYSCSFCRGQ